MIVWKLLISSDGKKRYRWLTRFRRGGIPDSGGVWLRLVSLLHTMPSQVRNGALSGSNGRRAIVETANQDTWCTHGWQRYDKHADIVVDATYALLIIFIHPTRTSSAVLAHRCRDQKVA